MRRVRPNAARNNTTVATTECTCGNRYGLDDSHHAVVVEPSTDGDSMNTGTQQQQQQKDSVVAALPLDASFVHLPPSLLVRQEEEEEEHKSYYHFLLQQQQQHGRLSAGATTATAELWNSGGSTSSYYCYYYYNPTTIINAAPSALVPLLLPERYKHLALLEQAAAAAAANNNDEISLSPAPPPPPMCLECVHRVQQALELDTDRLHAECVVYRQAVKEKELRVQDWKRIVGTTTATTAGTATAAAEAKKDDSSDDDAAATSSTAKSQDNDHSDNNLIQRAKQAFQMEIEILQDTCQQHEEELLHLQSVRKELLRVSQEIDQAEEIMNEERNALALEARAFRNDQEQCHRILSEIHEESERLSSPAIRLPSLLLDLRVDKERGLRYPLINDLRLAYRPKGDVQWEEIQAAWSLAAQLLLYVGTIFEFQSRNWRIVPLSSSAKLIYHPSRDNTMDKEDSSSARIRGSKGTVVYNLGHHKTHNSRALLAWNALLHQLASCVLGKMNQACDRGLMDTEAIPRLPYEMTSTKIGIIALTELNDSDDTGWSRAIHCMSSNLLWMSDCASVYLLHQIIPQCIV